MPRLSLPVVRRAPSDPDREGAHGGRRSGLASAVAVACAGLLAVRGRQAEAASDRISRAQRIRTAVRPPSHTPSDLIALGSAHFFLALLSGRLHREPPIAYGC